MHCRPRTLAATLIVAMTYGTGCFATQEELDRGFDGGVAAAEEPLWASSGVDLWPDGKIEVCFGAERWTTHGTNRFWPEPMPTGSDAWLEQKALIQTLLEDTYEKIPGANIDFWGWDACPQAEVGTATRKLRITLRDDGSFNWAFRHCGVGEYYLDANGDDKVDGCESRAGYAPTKEAHIATSRYGYSGHAYDAAVLHEVGHALGFSHEYERSDASGGCVDDLPGPGSGNGLFLTTYDHASIMNQTYCNTTGLLTSRDELGVEIMYPGRFTGHPISGRNSFVLGSGRMVLRGDDAIVTDWSRRGAAAAAYGGGTVSWFRNGVSQGTALEFAASRLSGGSGTVRATFTDRGGRNHDTVTGSFSVDRGLHSALVHTLIWL